MEASTSPPSSIRSMSDLSAFNTPSPSPELQANTDTGIGRERRNGTEKLNLVWRYIVDEMNWSIGDFVHTLCTSEGQANTRRKTAFARVAYQDLAVLDACIGRSGGPGTAESRGHLIEYLDIGAIELRKEIASLARFKPFHRSQEAEDGGFERLDMRKLIETAEKTCPLLLRTLRGVIQPHSQVRGGYDNLPPQVDGVLVNILAVMCGSQRRNESSGFQLQLSVYLHSKGVKRRQIEALHRLGLCCSYHKTLQVIKRQSEAAAEAVTLRGQQPTAVTAYDNFEQMEHVKEQRVDNESSFHSVTTGQLIEGIEMPEGGLLQSMQNRAARLRVQDIFCCPGNEADAAELEISRYFVYESLRAAFPEDVSVTSPPRMPVIDILPRRTTMHLSLGPIPHDESTNAGNLNVLSNIFQQQYRLPDEAFKERLLLIYGDQKTTQRIRTIKSRRARAARPVDSLRWALPIPALFHIKMNYLYLLSRTHFGSAGDGSEATLWHAMNFWIRKGISKKKADFHALEQLIIQSFQARVCAFMWSKLNELQLGSTETDISAILRSYGPEELNGLVDRVVQTYTFASRYTENPELRNHVLFLQHAQNYLLLKYAVKHADLGLLRRAIARSCVYFHASGQHKYAYEMLYLQRLISTDAAAPELQRAILANGLVNSTGVHDSWYEIDRLVEFHNGTLKTIFNDRRGSSVTVKYLMENCALNTEFFKAIAEDMESFLLIKQNGVHAEKPAIIDLRLMARALVKSGSIKGTQRHVVTHDAVDLFDAAIPKLAGEALCKFNKKESTDQLDLSANDSDTEEDEAVDAVDEFFTIEASDET